MRPGGGVDVAAVASSMKLPCSRCALVFVSLTALASPAAVADDTMPGTAGSHDMAMSIMPLGLPMTRHGSGTAWRPDATPLYAHHVMAGGWMLMLHYDLAAGYGDQGSARGDVMPILLGWVMGMAAHGLAGGELELRAMLSPELAMGRRGYPLLLQTGEEVGGEPLHDRQHPHDVFMELAATYARAVSDDVALELYVAPSGEPALGPVAYPHRAYAIYDPIAPLGHHWEDSTHISYGVITAGAYTRQVKLEGSWFNGREPDEDRYDLDLRVPDSGSVRLTVNPSASWSAQVSYGYLTAPELLEPGVNTQRVTASATYAGAPAGHELGATLVLGRNMPFEGPSTNASLLEGSVAVGSGVVAFGRVEWLAKTGADLALPADQANRVFGIGAFSLGAMYELPAWHGIVTGLGARGTLDAIGAALEPFYGTRTPLGGFLYVAIHPAAEPVAHAM